MSNNVWAIGVDIGGTKVNVSGVDSLGQQIKQIKFATDVCLEPPGMIKAIANAVNELCLEINNPPVGIGVGVAGQIEAGIGVINFAPNLPGWRNIPLQSDLCRITKLPVLIDNDVRVAGWAEWIHGAGRGCNDIVFLFLGTGIGGCIISKGNMLTGSTNSAGELGHIPIDLLGPPCTCGNIGCLEALASGWAIAKKAQQVLSKNPNQSKIVLNLAKGDINKVTARMVIDAAHHDDIFAKEILLKAKEALQAGAVGIVNAFNPSRLIIGGGLFEGQPELLEDIRRSIAERALPSAKAFLQVLPAQLGNNAGVIGAATLVMHQKS